MTKKFCDKCKREMSMAASSTRTYFLVDGETTWRVRTDVERGDLCAECRREIVTKGQVTP